MLRTKFRGSNIDPKYFARSQIKFYAILLPLALFMIIPVVFVAFHAFKTLPEILAFPPVLIPARPTFINFRRLFNFGAATGVPFMRYAINSLIVASITVVFSLIISILGAYALSKKNFRLKGWFFKINQAALMFVPIAVTVPRFMLVINMGLVNTWWAHVLPFLVMPVGLFLMKQFIDQIPDALLEAAKIDGANDLTVIRKVIIPLSRPAIATVAILAFQMSWGNVEASNNYITNESMRTLAPFVNTLAGIDNPLMAGLVAAAGLILFVPNLIIFIVMQSQVMNTMSHSGIK